MKSVTTVMSAALAAAIIVTPAQADAIGPGDSTALAKAEFSTPEGRSAEFPTPKADETPIPAALPLILAGLAGLGIAGRGKTQKAKVSI